MIKHIVAVLLASLSATSVGIAKEISQQEALKTFAEIPVLELGRYKPWDSVARNSLLMIHERQVLQTEAGKRSAIEWLAELLFDSRNADKQPVFRIMHPDVRVLLGNEDEQQKFVSFTEIVPYMTKLAEQAEPASKLESQLRTPYQRAVVTLSRNLTMYQALKHTLSPPGQATLQDELKNFKRWADKPYKAFQMHQNGNDVDPQQLQLFFQTASIFKRLDEMTTTHPVPGPNASQEDDWVSLWNVLVISAPKGEVTPVIQGYADLSQHYQARDWAAFKATSEQLKETLRSIRPEATDTAGLETTFNRSKIFYRTSVLYVLIFLIVMASWIKMKWQTTLGRVAFWLVAAALVLHTAGLILRMVIQDRPPVTNLYSSALFVGWGAVVLGLFMERLFKNGIGAAAASAVGFMTLIVAHHLGNDGDTMTMMQAVLDTNFWLATHVVIITFGYSATFFAGFLAIMYILFGFFTKLLNQERAKSLETMVYGIICFALLFSFVGTVLGGIWADQSWGRFWGWDPKENGALLIVLWNAIILHARWGKLIASQGIMVAAVFGNIVTAWSWFGTNMLGVGLHSYGFMDQAFFWLVAFAFFMLMIMAIGVIPVRLWDSFVTQKKLSDQVEAASSA